MLVITEHVLLQQRRQLVTLRRPARVLAGGIRLGELVIWTVEDEGGSPVEKAVFLVPTGQQAATGSCIEFLGTVIAPSNAAWHLFWKDAEEGGRLTSDDGSLR